MPVDDERTRLRVAVIRGDGDTIRYLRQEPWPEHGLQLIGEGLLRALEKNADGAPELAARCVAALRDRDWSGDAELADQLAARAGSAPYPLLKPLTVDLEELSGILEGDPVNGGGEIDLTTGEVWPQSAIEYAMEVGDRDEEDDDPDRWLGVHCEGSRDAFRDIELFIDCLSDARVAERLTASLHGRRPFRRFRDRLSEHPTLVSRFLALSDERSRGRARAWLAEEGYAALPPRYDLDPATDPATGPATGPGPGRP